MDKDHIRTLPCWKGAIEIEPLVGGITNVNFRVRNRDEDFVARLCEDKQYLGIDRQNERVCHDAAFHIGVAPEVVYHDDGILVSRYVEAVTLSAADVQNEELLTRLAMRLRQLHASRDRLVGDMHYFCPFQTIRTYAETARRLGARLPDGIDDSLNDAWQLSREMAPFHPTLCHNDLLPANIIDDGKQLWLVDWEYAAIGNPLFDLAGISSNAQLTDELEACLLAAYAGHDDADLRRQVRILKTASLLREALWSVIQTVASDIEFDYVQYAESNLAAYREARQKL